LITQIKLSSVEINSTQANYNPLSIEIDWLLGMESSDPVIDFDPSLEDSNTEIRKSNFDFEELRFQIQPVNEEPLAEDANLESETSPRLPPAGPHTLPSSSTGQSLERLVQARLENSTLVGREAACESKLGTEVEQDIEV